MNWVTTTLGDFAPLVYGKSLPKRTRATDGQIDVFGSGGVDGKHEEALTNGPTVVVGRKGTVGKVHFSPNPCWPIDTTYFIEDADRELARFKFYMLQTLGLNKLNYDSAVPGLKRDQAHSIQIRVPSADVQRHVATALGTFDDLIENNRRRIEILEEMARLLYREWFVHFRFPGHEDVELVDSDLGPIPKGWEARRLGDLLELAYGKALKADDRTGGPVGVYGSGGHIGWHDEALVAGPGIVVGRKGNVGSVHWSDRDFFPIDTTYYVKSDLPLRFLDQMLRMQEFIDSHAAVPGLSRDQAYALIVATPAHCLLSRFENAVEPMYNLRRNLTEQNAVLREARDLLLPRLVSGELDVSELDLGLERVGA